MTNTARNISKDSLDQSAQSASTGHPRRARLALVTAALAAGALGVAGCSQIDSLQQVSGVPENTLQIAIGYELMDNEVPVLVAPVCTKNEPSNDFTCTGKTTKGEVIDVAATPATAATFTLSPGGTPTALPAGTLEYNMVIKVGSKEIYSGGVQAAISANQDGAQ